MVHDRKLRLVAVLLLASCAAFAAEKEKKAKAKKEEQPKNPAELFTPSKESQAKEQAIRNIGAQIEAEVAARNVPLPPEMDLDVEWYSPHLDAAVSGRMVKGWVIGELVLLETDKRNLICVRRADGLEKWRCELSEPIRYSPAVSRNNVVVNINNHLVAIHKESGYVRWKLLPKFVMSCAPLVVDPPAYPREYAKEWTPLEMVYVGGWDGRIYSMTVRGRLTNYVKNIPLKQDFAAPEFDLYYSWHKTHRERGFITTNILLREDTLYYVADDRQVYAVSREGVEREPYYMLGRPTTGLTVSAVTAANVTDSFLSSVYAGADDNYIYCLDRLTLKKKWAYAAGVAATGTILADEAPSAMAYVPTSDGKVHGLRVERARMSKGQPEIPESFSHAWEVKGEGAITASPDTVYLGSQRNAELNSYKGISAVDKVSGKVKWSANGGFFTQYLEFHNAWMNPAMAARVYAITADNRVVSLKEKVRDTGVRVIKIPSAEPEMPKMPGKKAAPAAPAAEGAPPAAPAPAAPEAPAPEPKK